MNTSGTRQKSIPMAISVAALLLLALSCAAPASTSLPVSPTTPASPPQDPWSGALQATPFPYLIPLPAPTRTKVDGSYAKVELKDTPPVHCLRCPDYAPEGGIWKLYLDRGIFRILHEPSGWSSMGSFVLARDRWTADAEDRILLFNDPVCPDAVGLYGWRLEEGNLILEVVDDACAIHLRAVNLTNLPWLSCTPPNTEAAITDHWPKPPGCD